MATNKQNNYKSNNAQSHNMLHGFHYRLSTAYQYQSTDYFNNKKLKIFLHNVIYIYKCIPHNIENSTEIKQNDGKHGHTRKQGKIKEWKETEQ